MRAEDLYAFAITTSRLNLPAVGGERSAAAVLMAAGWAGRGDKLPLTTLLQRLRIEWDRCDLRSAAEPHVRTDALVRVPTYGAASEALARYVLMRQKVITEARGFRPLAPESCLAVSREWLLRWVQAAKCPACRGVRYERLPNTSRLSDRLCQVCCGHGSLWPFLPLSLEGSAASVYAAIDDELRRKFQTFATRMRRSLMN